MGMHFKKLFNETNADFLQYLQIEFILKLLENKEYNFDASFDFDDFEFYDFEHMVAQTIEYLWFNKIWKALDQILLALHENNGLRLLDDDYFLDKLCHKSNTTETYIGIFVKLYHYKVQVEYIVCTFLAKSIYFQFIDKEEQKSREQLVILSNECLINTEVLTAMIHFLGESMFDFVSNESKKEYLDIILIEYENQFHKKNFTNSFAR